MILESSKALGILVGVLLVFVLGAFSTLLFFKSDRLSRFIANSCSILGSVGLISGAFMGFFGKSQVAILVRGIFSFANVEIRVNSYSALFIFLIGSVGLITSIYAIGYAKEYQERKSIPLLTAGMQIFLMAMTLVVLAGNVFTFLTAWEIMSIVVGDSFACYRCDNGYFWSSVCT